MFEESIPEDSIWIELCETKIKFLKAVLGMVGLSIFFTPTS